MKRGDSGRGLMDPPKPTAGGERSGLYFERSLLHFEKSVTLRKNTAAVSKRRVLRIGVTAPPNHVFLPSGNEHGRGGGMMP